VCQPKSQRWCVHPLRAFNLRGLSDKGDKAQVLAARFIRYLRNMVNII